MSSMQMAMVGLGRLGGNIVRRLMAYGHECVVHDRDAEAVEALAGEAPCPPPRWETWWASSSRPAPCG